MNKTSFSSISSRDIGKRLLMLVALAFALLWSMPLIWALIASLRPIGEQFTRGQVWFHGGISLANYQRAFSLAPFGRYFFNTLLMVALILSIQLITSSLAGYAFAVHRFPGDRLLFGIILTQMMIPTAALLVPNFQTIRIMGLYDHLLALVLPFGGSAFGTFLLRQSFRAVPRDYADAARIDGCTWWQSLWYVYIPSARASIIAFSISSISWHWNDLLWPLIITQSERSRPLTAGLIRFTQLGEIGAQWGLMSAATIIVALPLLVLFFVFQKQFMEGFMQSGLK